MSEGLERVVTRETRLAMAEETELSDNIINIIKTTHNTNQLDRASSQRGISFNYRSNWGNVLRKSRLYRQLTRPDIQTVLAW